MSSTPEEEALALDAAQHLLIQIGSGHYRVTSIRRLRAECREVLRHYPLAPGESWLGFHEAIDR